MHTPGPWTADRNIIGADRTVVGTVNRPAGGSKQTEDANARLIAAAPDLLKSLECLVRCVSHNDKNGVYNLDSALLAIAKAKH